jgi:hypothetical protein
MGKHKHGKRKRPSDQVPAAESAVRPLPSWLETAAQQNSAASPTSSQAWPVRLDRLLTPALRTALVTEGFSTCADLAALLPYELVELDSTLSIPAADSILQSAAKHALVELNDPADSKIADFTLVAKRVAICKLQPIQIQKSSFSLSASEQKALPVKGKDRRQYFLEILWFVFMIMGPTGLLWSVEVEHDANLAKSAFLMKFQTHSEDQLAPPANIMKRWVEWHNCHIGSQARFWDARATSLHSWFLQLQHRGPSVVHNALRHLNWWKTHVGVPFPTEDVLLIGWRTVQGAASIEAPLEVAPLELSVFFRLVEVAARSYGAVSQFCALALILLAACLRYKHYNLSKALHRSGDFLRATCIRGKRRSAGKRPPFDWGCPWSIGGKEPFKCVLILIAELKQVLGRDPGFILPNFQGKTAITEKTWYEPRPMPYPRFLAFFRAWLGSQGISKEQSKKFVSYSLRRFLPSLADIARAPLSVRQELGNWVETPFSKKQAESSSSCMAVRYAHNRVETAADSKFRLLAGLYEVQKQSKAELTWENLRCERFLWEKLLQLKSGAFEPTVDQRESDDDLAPSTASAPASSSGSSSTDESQKAKNTEEVSWFRQPSSRIFHALQAATETRLIPWCRDGGFKALHAERGVGMDDEMQVCPNCLKRMPPSLAEVLRTLPSSCD